MDHTYWHKQEIDQPLFPDLLWSKPETKHTAGKLLIIGGNSHRFSSVAENYQTAITAGIGTVKVILPDVLRKIAGTLENFEFAPSTPSGSFSQNALSVWLDNAEWADATLLTGDFSKNSETGIIIEKFLNKNPRAISLVNDAVDYVIPIATTYVNRPLTTLIANVEQLQKLATALSFYKAFKHNMNLMQIIETLHEFTLKYSIEIVTFHLDFMIVAINGQISTTKHTMQNSASLYAVWRLQNPTKPFQAITSSVLG